MEKEQENSVMNRNSVHDMNIGDTRNISIKELYDYVNNENGSFEILTNSGYQPIGDVYKKLNKQIYT
jgi:hypothetical protein